MKTIKIICSFLAILLFVNLQAQKQIPIKTGKPKAIASKSINISGVSPRTAMLILDMEEMFLKKSDSVLTKIKEEYLLKEIENVLYVPAFVQFTKEADLSKYQIKLGVTETEIKTALIPLHNLVRAAGDENISYIQIADKVELTLDEARSATRVNQAHSGSGGLSKGYSGNGVVVGIIDDGFDYTHPTYYDATTGEYRIKRVWDHNSTTGFPPNGYNYGREFIGEANIVSAQTDDVAQSHGSHVSGTAAGSGAGTDGVYRGVAYKSDIVLVATDFSTTGIAEGIEYIYNYANSVNKPCVINMSIGGHFGPHDGESAFDKYCDAILGKGKILVGSNGNSGDDEIHIGKNFTGQDTLIYSFVKFSNASNGSTNGIAALDIWGAQNQTFFVSVNIFNTEENEFEDFTPYVNASTTNTVSYTLSDNDTFFPDDCFVDISSEINPINNKPHIVVSLDNFDQDDDYRWVLIEIIGYNTEVNMWAIRDAVLTDNDYNSPVVSGDVNSTMGEIGGTGKRIVSVGAYTSKNDYVDFRGNSRFIPFFEDIGEIAPFSSNGPTADGRAKPDITAPGNVIVAPVNHYDLNYSSNSRNTVFGVTDGTTNWYYGAMQGTSMSAPMVTGILALWLEANPDLTPEEVKNYLKKSAIKDSYTGNIPINGNNTWGMGKINALNGLIEIEDDLATGINSNVLNPFSIYPNPTKGVFEINSEVEFISVKVLDVSGRIVKEVTLENKKTTIDISNEISSIYFVQLQDKNGRIFTEKIIKN